MAPVEGVHKKRTCVVCDELKLLSTFPTPFELPPHDHQHDICRECFSNHLEVEVNSKTWDQISCPQCPLILQREEINSLASPVSWEKYEHFSARAALSEMPDYRFCFSTSCNSGQIHEEGLVFSCKACGHKHCTACEVNWHEDETCEDYQTRNAAQKQQEEDSEARVHAISKACPNCATKIEKRDGCDHMTCSRCHYQFCWACLADFMPIARHGLHRHETSCRNYRPEGHLGIEEEDDGLMPWAQRPDAEDRLNAALQTWMDLMQILQGLPAQQPRD